MNQFTVPQFIDVEDKIFGPITSRQFIILLCGGLFCFAAYKLADTALFITLLASVGGFTLILAFVKINGQSFHYFILNILQTSLRPSLRIWNKTSTTAELNESIREKNKPPEEVEKTEIKRASSGHIRDLSLMVNTGGYYKGDE